MTDEGEFKDLMSWGLFRRSGERPRRISVLPALVKLRTQWIRRQPWSSFSRAACYHRYAKKSHHVVRHADQHSEGKGIRLLQSRALRHARHAQRRKRTTRPSASAPNSRLGHLHFFVVLTNQTFSDGNLTEGDRGDGPHERHHPAHLSAPSGPECLG